MVAHDDRRADALEDAAFRHVNDMSGAGTMKNLLSEIIRTNKEEELAEKLFPTLQKEVKRVEHIRLILPLGLARPP